MQLIGILIGQLMFGVMGDWIGRKATMLIDMSVILIGVILLTVSNGPTINVSFAVTAWCSLFASPALIAMDCTAISDGAKQHGNHHSYIFRHIYTPNSGEVAAT